MPFAPVDSPTTSDSTKSVMLFAVHMRRSIDTTTLTGAGFYLRVVWKGRRDPSIRDDALLPSLTLWSCQVVCLLDCQELPSVVVSTKDRIFADAPHSTAGESYGMHASNGILFNHESPRYVKSRA